MPQRGMRGFTLIELLVVIAVMALLMSILFPVARKAYDNANRSTCMNNLRSIAQMVAAYQQDYLVYPEPPNYTSLHGIPRGGITGLALANADIGASTFWCSQDAFSERFTGNVTPKPGRDLANSSYNFGYNYYGCVTTQDGLPYPVTTREAAIYFFGSSWKVYYETRYYEYLNANISAGMALEEASNDAKTRAIADTDAIPGMAEMKQWDLGLITGGTGGDSAIDYATPGRVADPDPPTDPEEFSQFELAASIKKTRFAGMFQGLCNFRASTETLITFCPHHPTLAPTVLPVVTLGGAVHLIKPVKPYDEMAADAYPAHPSSFNVGKRRAVNSALTPTDGSEAYYRGLAAKLNRRNVRPLIDWRTDKSIPGNKWQSDSYDDGGTTRYRLKLVPNANSLLGDARFNPPNMPIVDGPHYRFFQASQELKNNIVDGYGWYDTGIPVQSGDMVMVSANARWCWGGNSFFTGNKEYGPLYSDDKKIWFTADGDSIEAQGLEAGLGSYPTMLLPAFQAWQANHVYALGQWVQGGSRYFKCVKAGISAAAAPAWPGKKNARVVEGQDEKKKVVWVEGTPPPSPHALLVGYIGDLSGGTVDRKKTFAVGSHGAHLAGTGENATLKLSMNDTQGGYSDNIGWCEVWIAVFRPGS